MHLIIVSILVFVFLMAGCATGAKKQATQLQPVAYEKNQNTYGQDVYSKDYDDTWSSDVYKKPAQTTYSEPVVELSIKQIQRALKKAGFYKGEIDGKIGSKTKEAIIKFQKAHGLKADGVVGKRTLAELNKYLY